MGTSNILPATSTGALLIDYYGNSQQTTAQQRTSIIARETDRGQPFDGIGTHYGDGETPGSATPTDRETWIHGRGSVPVISWTPGRVNATQNRMIDINNGLLDTRFINAGVFFRSLGFRVILRMFWEFNGDWYDYSPIPNAGINNPGCTAAQWISAWQRAIKCIVTGSPTGTVTPGSSPLIGFAWSPAEQQDHTWRDNCYPGHGYVDWVSPDCYNHDGGPSGNDWSTSLHGNWAEARELWDYTNLGDASTSTYTQYGGSKPFIPGETGTYYDMAGRPSGHVLDVNRKANWYRNVDAVAKANMPNLRGMVFFDQLLAPVSGEKNDWRVDSDCDAVTAPTTPGNIDPVSYAGFVDLSRTFNWTRGVLGGAT